MKLLRISLSMKNASSMMLTRTYSVPVSFRSSVGSFWVQRGRRHFGRPLHTSPWLPPFQVGWEKAFFFMVLGRTWQGGARTVSFPPRRGFIPTYSPYLGWMSFTLVPKTWEQRTVTFETHFCFSKPLSTVWYWGGASVLYQMTLCPGCGCCELAL